jgi:hypothetical protein
MKIFITLIVLSALGLIHAKPASQSKFNQEEVTALLQNLMRSEAYQDTDAEGDNQNSFNALSLGDETANNQIFGWALKSAIRKIFNRKFRNAMFKLFKPCVCGEELVKEQQSDDDGDDDGAELMQDDEPDGGMYAEAEGRFSFRRLKKCIYKRIKRLPGLAWKYAG